MISLQRFVLQSAHIHILWCSPPRQNALVTIISFPKGDAFILTQHPLFIPLSFSLITHMQNHLLKAFHPDFSHTFFYSHFRLTLTHISFIPHTHTPNSSILTPFFFLLLSVSTFYLLPSHVSHVSTTLISSFYCCRCGDVDTEVVCCDTRIRTT